VRFDVLSQEPIEDFRGIDVTDVGHDWTAANALSLGSVDVFGSKSLVDLVSRFIVVNDKPTPDAWIVLDVDSTEEWHRGEPSRIVELENLEFPELTAQVRFSAALAEETKRGAAVTGVAYELHRDAGLFGDRILEFKVSDPGAGPKLNVMVPVLRLHCPKHAGCTAVEEYATERTDSVEAKVSLTPVGGGVGTETTVQSSARWDTDDGECLQYLVPAEVVTERGTLVYRGEEIKGFGSFELTRIKFVDGPHRQEAIPPDDDRCQQQPTEVANDRRLSDEEHIGAGNKGYGFKAVTKVTGTLSLGAALGPGLPSLSFEYRRDASISFTRSTTLTPGATYLAYTPEPPADRDRPEHWEILWTTY
jgi:hypothetical protein